MLYNCNVGRILRSFQTRSLILSTELDHPLLPDNLEAHYFVIAECLNKSGPAIPIHTFALA